LFKYLKSIFKLFWGVLFNFHHFQGFLSKLIILFYSRESWICKTLLKILKRGIFGVRIVFHILIRIFQLISGSRFTQFKSSQTPFSFSFWIQVWEAWKKLASIEYRVSHFEHNPSHSWRIYLIINQERISENGIQKHPWIKRKNRRIFFCLRKN